MNPVTNTSGDFPVGFGRKHFDGDEGDEGALRYSPVHHVSGETPPVLVVRGTADTAVHHENSVEFAEKVKRLGGHAEIILYPGAWHGFFNPREDDTYFERTTQDMIRFIRRVARMA